MRRISARYLRPIRQVSSDRMNRGSMLLRGSAKPSRVNCWGVPVAVSLVVVSLFVVSLVVLFPVVLLFTFGVCGWFVLMTRACPRGVAR